MWRCEVARVWTWQSQILSAALRIRPKLENRLKPTERRRTSVLQYIREGQTLQNVNRKLVEVSKLRIYVKELTM